MHVGCGLIKRIKKKKSNRQKQISLALWVLIFHIASLEVLFFGFTRKAEYTMENGFGFT